MMQIVFLHQGKRQLVTPEGTQDPAEVMPLLKSLTYCYVTELQT